MSEITFIVPLFNGNTGENAAGKLVVLILNAVRRRDEVTMLSSCSCASAVYNSQGRDELLIVHGGGKRQMAMCEI